MSWVASVLAAVILGGSCPGDSCSDTR